MKAWNEQCRAGAPKKRPECINQLKKNNRRTKLPNTVSIDTIYDRNFLSLSSVLEAVIVDTFSLPGNLYLRVDISCIVHVDYYEADATISKFHASSSCFVSSVQSIILLCDTVMKLELGCPFFFC